MLNFFRRVCFIAVSILVLGVCNQGNAQQVVEIGTNEENKTYNFISNDFLKAIQNVRRGYFFDIQEEQITQEIPPKENSETKLKILKPALIRYEKLGADLCGPIADSYHPMIEKGVNGEDAFAFDRELTDLMRKSGAFVLPLRLTGGAAEGLYEIPELQNFKEQYSSLPSYRRFGYGPFYQPDGLVKFSARDYTNFYEFHKMASGYDEFNIKEFKYSFSFVRSYLFIFKQDENDLNKESIFFYVDFPFDVSGNNYGEVEKLIFKPDDISKVKCFTVSKSLLLFTGEATSQRFKKEKRAVASITDIEPLTIPLNIEYRK